MIPAWAIPDIEQTECQLCGKNAQGGILCEECREYVKINDDWQEWAKCLKRG